MRNTSAGVEIRQENPVNIPAQVDSKSKVENGDKNLLNMWLKGTDVVSEDPANIPAQVDSEPKVETGEEKKLDGKNNSPPFGNILGADIGQENPFNIPGLVEKKPKPENDEKNLDGENKLLGADIGQENPFNIPGLVKNTPKAEKDEKNLDGETISPSRGNNLETRSENPLNIPAPVDSETKVKNEEKKNPDREDTGAHSRIYNWIKATGLVAGLGGLAYALHVYLSGSTSPSPDRGDTSRSPPPTPSSSSASPSHFLMALLAVPPLAVVVRFVLHLFHCDEPHEWGRRLLLLTSSWCIFSFFIWYFLI